ncbi:MAG: FeoC-like transcriptional regulator [Chloroflexota bacterium]|nr:FeoC-like transcriptional regulator [Chloroflexota bacterium]
MLRQLLLEFETAQGPVNLTELTRKLGVDRSALDGMIAYWVRKGRIKDDQAPGPAQPAMCAGSSCGTSCSGLQECPFIVTLPRTFSLNERWDDGQ